MIDVNSVHLPGLLLALNYCGKYEDKQFLGFLIEKARSSPVLRIHADGSMQMVCHKRESYVDFPIKRHDHLKGSTWTDSYISGSLDTHDSYPIGYSFEKDGPAQTFGELSE